MNKELVNELLSLRDYLIESHGKLDGVTNPSGAIMKQIHAAKVYTNAIKKIEKLLGGHVKFE